MNVTHPPVQADQAPLRPLLRQHPTAAGRARAWLRAHALSIVLLAVVLVPIAVVHATGMAENPTRHDDEGTYTAQAYVFGREARLSHYTYWYDHPPVGWIKLAVYDLVTGATERAEHAIAAQREAMLLAHVVASILLFALCRRLGIARRWGLLAVALFSLSPLALIYHRMVFLDNLAVPWLIGAFLLALTPGKRLFAYAGSAVCFAMAVFTKETMLLALPALLYQVWQNTDASNRRYAWSVFGSFLVLTGLMYPLFAALQGELLPGPGHVSLWEAIKFHLVDRDPERPFAIIDAWRTHDQYLLLLGAVAAVPAVAQRRLRPYVLLVAMYVAMMLRPGGYLPEPYVIVFFLPAALFVAGVLDAVSRWRPVRVSHATTWPQRLADRVPAALAAVAAAAITAVAVVAWTPGIAEAMRSDRDAPKRAAEAWVREHVSRDQRVLVENTIWVDLVRAGFPEENVVWFYKLGLDPASLELYPQGHRDFDYIVGSPLIEGMANMLEVEELQKAYENSTVVAAWGDYWDRVEIRRIHGGGTAGDAQQTSTEVNP